MIFSGDEQRLIDLLTELGLEPAAKMVKDFWFDGERYTRLQYDELADDMREALEEWETAVREALSDDLPPNYFSNGKPRWKARPANRRYPFSVSGALADSVRTGVRLSLTDKKNLSIHSWAEISHPHGGLTTANVTRFPRKDGRKPNWIGWRDRVFTQGDPQFNIVSVADIFREMTTERRKERPGRKT